MALGAGVAPTVHVAVVAAALLVVAAVAGGTLLPAHADQNDSAPPGRGALSPTVLLLGVLGFLGLMGEGAVADWSAVYYRDVLAADPGTAGLGFAAFSLAMTAGRLSGDAVRARLGDLRIVLLGGLIAAVGLAASVAATTPLPAAVGFLAFGIGIANIVPVLFSAAGRHGEPGRSIAQVSVIAYLGFLAGPPLIGFVAQAVGLRASMLVIAASAMLIALMAKSALRER